MDLALNNLQRLICHKTQPTNQSNSQLSSNNYANQTQIRIFLFLKNCRLMLKSLESILIIIQLLIKKLKRSTKREIEAVDNPYIYIYIYIYIEREREREKRERERELITSFLRLFLLNGFTPSVISILFYIYFLIFFKFFYFFLLFVFLFIKMFFPFFICLFFPLCLLFFCVLCCFFFLVEFLSLFPLFHFPSLLFITVFFFLYLFFLFIFL